MKRSTFQLESFASPVINDSLNIVNIFNFVLHSKYLQRSSSLYLQLSNVCLVVFSTTRIFNTFEKRNRAREIAGNAGTSISEINERTFFHKPPRTPKIYSAIFSQAFGSSYSKSRGIYNSKHFVDQTLESSSRTR